MPSTAIYTLSLHDALPISFERLQPSLGVVDCLGCQLRILQWSDEVAIRAHVNDSFGIVRLIFEDFASDLECFGIILLVIKFIRKAVPTIALFVSGDPSGQVLNNLSLTLGRCCNRAG